MHNFLTFLSYAAAVISGAILNSLGNDIYRFLFRVNKRLPKISVMPADDHPEIIIDMYSSLVPNLITINIPFIVSNNTDSNITINSLEIKESKNQIFPSFLKIVTSKLNVVTNVAPHNTVSLTATFTINNNSSSTYNPHVHIDHYIQRLQALDLSFEFIVAGKYIISGKNIEFATILSSPLKRVLQAQWLDFLREPRHPDIDNDAVAFLEKELD